MGATLAYVVDGPDPWRLRMWFSVPLEPSVSVAPAQPSEVHLSSEVIGEFRAGLASDSRRSPRPNAAEVSAAGGLPHRCSG